jgi:hypothetical protein
MKLLIIEDEFSLLKSIIAYFLEERLLCDNASIFAEYQNNKKLGMKSLRPFNCFFVTLLVISSCIISCKGQRTFGEQYLELQKRIFLPGVKGRIDHFAIDLKDQIAFVAALGNNTLEVVDLGKGKVAHSITGLSEPQGVEYIPQYDEIFVANGGNGECYFYNAHTYKKTATIQLPSDADDVRYDSAHEKIYVGYGEGGIAIIDAGTKKQTGDIKLPAHAEGFQVDLTSGQIWVNVPNARMITVLNGKKDKVETEWKIRDPSAYFPMAYDDKGHRLFVACRRPSRLLILDSESGHKIAELPCAGDADDLYYDANTHRVLISGGSGYINIFQQQNANTYQEIANIPTRPGARTSLCVPQLHQFLVAERASGGNEAELLVYQLR